MVKKCPICGKEYTGLSKQSLTDRNVFICAECGQRQALESIGVTDRVEQNRIINVSKDYGRSDKNEETNA